MFDNKMGEFFFVKRLSKPLAYKMRPFKIKPAYSDESIINALAIFKSLFMKIKWDF